MLNLFVLDVLNAFQPEEKEDFRVYLSSLFFNKGANREPLIALLELILAAQESENIDDLEKETIFQILYPNKELVESKVDKLISELKRHVQNFLTVRKHLSPENDNQRALDFASELRQKGLDARYRQTLAKIKKESEQDPLEAIESYFFKFLIAVEEHEWHSVFNKSKGDIHITEVILTLDNYYWSLRVEMLNRLLIQQKLAALPSNALALLEESLVFPSKALEGNALIGVIWGLHQSMKATVPDEQHFFHLQERIKTNEAKFSNKKLAEFNAYLRNLCSMLLDAGKSEFKPILHDLQRNNLERGYFYFDGKIAPNAFLSITQTALNVGAVDWANAFVEKHKNRIVYENETDDFYRLNKGLCLFEEKQYEAALEMIPFTSTNSSYHLIARRLELKIYYELDSDLLPYKIDAFKMLLSRINNKVISKHRQELFVNFSNFLRQLSLSPNSRDKSRAEKMAKRINAKELVAERAWLLEKARELGERKIKSS